MIPADKLSNSNPTSLARLQSFIGKLSPAKEALLWWLLTLLVLILGIGSIDQPIFDEAHYVPAAKEWIAGSITRNIEHPPLAKILMALSIQFLGDHAWAWRLPGVLVASLTMLPLFSLGLLWDPSKKSSRILVFLTLTNFVFFAQSRVAMLDTFMIFFFVTTIYYTVKILLAPKLQPWDFYKLMVGGGFGVATKWAMLPFFALLLGLLFFWKVIFFASIVQGSREPRFFVNLRQLFEPVYLKVGALGFLLLFLTYELWFIPYSFVELKNHPGFLDPYLNLQHSIYKLQRTVAGDHPYKSTWWSWPLMLRPIWYYYQKMPDPGWIKGILFIGNPLQTWGLFPFMTYVGFKLKNRINYLDLFWLTFWIGSLLLWPLIPRKITYFYYYYPNLMLTSIVLGYGLFRLQKKWLTVTTLSLNLILCLYFFPVLSGLIPFPAKWVPLWTWFRAWI